MNYRYEIRDTMGRLWKRTLTRAKAAKIVQYIYRTKGLTCVIVEIGG